jgi:ankyrin repeat protein
LLQAGADPTLRNLYARSPVNIASENEHPEIVKLVEDFDYRELELIDASAKGALERMDEILASGPLFIDAANEDGWTALIFAVDRGHRESARKLLKAGADVNIAENTGWTPLMFATYDKDVEMQQILTNFGAAPQYLRRRTHHRL